VQVKLQASQTVSKKCPECQRLNDSEGCQVAQLHLKNSSGTARVLLYGLECYSLTIADVKSLDFTVIRFLMKLFKSSNMDIINDCLLHFKFSLPSELIQERKLNLLANLLAVTICFGNSELTLFS